MNLNLGKSPWKRVAFDDMIDSITDRVDNPSEAGVDRYVGLEHLDPGVMTVQRWDSPDKVEAQKLRFQPGDVIFGRRRAYQKKVAKAEFEGICSAHALVLRGRPDYIDSDFLPVFLSSDYFLERAIEISVGSLSPTVNWRDLKVQEFELPPIDEQKRIADLLWVLERHRLTLKAAASAARRAASALIAQVRETSVGSVSLASVASVRNGQTFPKRLQGQSSGEIPFFKVSDLDSPGNERWLTRPANWITEAEATEIGARALQPGTIVTVRVGAALRSERRRMFRHPALVDENHLIISPTGTDSKFLWGVLNETRLSESRNDGVVPSLNQKIVGAVDVPAVPRDRAAAVGERYLQAHEAADALAGEEDALRLLRSALLASIFGGS